jgi:hypothetical protein
MPNIENDTSVARIAPAEPGRAEQLQVRERLAAAVGDPALDEGQQAKYRDTSRDEHQGRRVGPAVLPRLDEAVGQRDHAQGGYCKTRQVDARPPLRPGLRHQHRDRGERDDHDRDVDQEDRAPPEVAEQVAADDRADREAEHGRPGDGGDRLLPLLRCEQDGKHGKREGEDRRRADAEHGAGGDELADRGRVGTGGRAGTEEDQGDEQHPLATVAVAEQARGQDQRREHEAVGVGDPLQVAR